LTTDSKII